MKIGMIGIGDIAAKAYLPVLTQMEDVELHICTRKETVLKKIAAKYRISHTYQHLEDFLQSGVEAAFVHSATDSHEKIIDQLLDHHIHVYVDKPITYDGESSTRLIKKAEEKGLLLMVGFNRSYAPPYQFLKELKEPNMVLVEKNRANHPDDARTFIFDDFIHVIDTMLHLFPYQVENYRIRGVQQDGKLYHVTLQLEAKEGTAIGIMNRDAGTTGEKAKVFSTAETREVHHVNEMVVLRDKNRFVHGGDDWEPTLKKRGFHHIISAFLDKVRSQSIVAADYTRDLERHLIAERIVQELAKNK